VILFSLATVVLLWLIAKRVVVKPSETTWFLWLVFLIPGFFVLSTRLMLDVPLTFGFALLLYLLLIQARAIWVGLALAVIMLTKGYGLILATPLVLVAFIFQLLSESDGWLARLKHLAGRLLGAFLLPLALATLILTTNWLPFPRLLETNLIQYFGDAYVWFVKGSLWLAEHVAWLIDWLLSWFGEPTAPLAGQIAELSSAVTATGEFPSALFESPLAPETEGGFVRKLWLIYQYNFSEQDISVFLLPLFGTGLVLRLRHLFSLGKSWVTARTDLLFLVLTAIFAYLNWHEALNLHGFRLTVPLSLAMIYFSYFGARAILIEKSRLAWWVFSLLLIASVSLYAHFVAEIASYGSVIANQSLFGWILKYKVWLFGSAFLATFAFLRCYPNWRWPHKPALLTLLIIGFWLIKLLPLGLEARAARATFEYDYGLAKASPLLVRLRDDDQLVASNLRPYTINYYALNLALPNEGAWPLVREFSERYPERYYRFYLPGRPLTDSLLAEREISNIFFVNNSNQAQVEQDFQAMLQALTLPYQIVEEARHPQTGRLQWVLYKVE
jgi:hypothetical protein